MSKGLFFMLISLALGGLLGCRANSRPPIPPAVVTPPPQEPMASADNPGSLFDPGAGTMYFADARAKRVGDILLINVVESTLATNKASTTADKAGSTNMGVSAFLGQQKMPIVPDVKLGSPLVAASNANTFKGDGETKRESTISTTVAARVSRILGGGLMEVTGARETRVNGETQIIVIQGVAREQDIDATNTIQSTNLAEARIDLYGEGVLAEKQRPGWLGRMLENVWPF